MSGAATGDRPFIDRLLPAPAGGGFAMDDWWVWCGSAIRGEDRRYHLFASRWPRRFPFFTGYIAASEVVRASADSPAGPYRYEEVVLPVRGADCWDGRMTHNPTIHRCGDTYLLFYIGATYNGPVPKPESLWDGTSAVPTECYARIRIGLATAPSIFGPWRRSDAPILAPRPGCWDGGIVTNPAPCVLADGRVLLLYRSNTPRGLRIGAAMAARFDAPFERLSEEPILASDERSYVEDPFVWQGERGFELLAKDWTGNYTGEKGAGVHATSPDGLRWSPFRKAYSRRVRWSDGKVTVQSSFERPQLLIENGIPTHLFAATSDGPETFKGHPTTFDTESRSWNMVIPLAL